MDSVNPQTKLRSTETCLNRLSPMLRDMPLSVFFDAMAVNLDAEAVGDRKLRVGFEFTDEPARYTYVVRKGVSEVMEGISDCDIHVRGEAQSFKEMLAGTRNPTVAVVKDFEVVTGGRAAFVRFMSWFVPDWHSDS